MASLTSRILLDEDVENIVELATKMAPLEDIANMRNHLNLLCQQQGIRRGTTTYLRTFHLNGELVGFIYARILTEGTADEVWRLESLTKLAAYRELSAVTDAEFWSDHRSSNYVLDIGHFVWDQEKIQIVEFCRNAVERLVRAFEGYRITGVQFSFYSDFDGLIGSAFCGALNHLTAWKRILPEFSVARVGRCHLNGIVRSFGWIAMGNWGPRLLDSCPTSDPPNSSGLTRELALKIRVLYEFEFDFVAALSSGLIDDWADNGPHHHNLEDRFPSSKTVKSALTSIMENHKVSKPMSRNNRWNAIFEFVKTHPWILNVSTDGRRIRWRA